MNDSKLAMWRSLIALAYVDGELEPQEKAVLLGRIRASRLSDDVKQQLIADIATSVVFSDVFKTVTDIQDRAHVINTAMVLFYSDADFEAAEKKIFTMLNEQQRHLVDYDAAKAQVRSYITEFKVQDAKSEDAEFSKGGRLHRMIGYIVKHLPDSF